MILTFTVPEGADRKVYTVLRRELKASAALVRRLKNAGAIFVNGEPAFTDRIMHPGDILTADISGCEPEGDIVPEDGEISVIYEDEGLIAVNKAPGILVHPSHARYTGTLSNFVAGYLQRTEGIASVHSVNRLDRDTSGVVLFAKNSYIKSLASDVIGSGDVRKGYTAVVLGEMPTPAGTIDAPIKRISDGDMKRAVSPDGQRAVTHYSTICTKNIDGFTLSLLSLKLETGRTHQIRVHCTHMGCPLLGDVLYYTDTSKTASSFFGIHAQLLHAQSMTLIHPLTGNFLFLSAPIIREDMTKILPKLNLV